MVGGLFTSFLLELRLYIGFGFCSSMIRLSSSIPSATTIDPSDAHRVSLLGGHLKTGQSSTGQNRPVR